MKNDNEGLYYPDITSYLEGIHLSHTQIHKDFHILKFEDHVVAEAINKLIILPRKVISRKQGFFQITTSKNHNVDLTVDGTKFKGMKENIVFIAPDQSISVNVKSIKKKGVGYMLVFSSDFLSFAPSNYSLLKNFPFFNMNRPPVYFLDEDHNDFFINQMGKIHDYFKNLDKDNLEIIRSYVTILLFEAKRMFIDGVVKSMANSRAEEITYLFESLIRQTKGKRQKLEFYADKLNFSPIYLAECVMKATRKTAKRIITEYLILESKSRLNQSTKTINDIAFQLGFNDTSNFIAFFKKNTESTPSQYRKL